MEDITNAFLQSTIFTKNPWNTYSVYTFLSLCNVEMWLQSYVTATTLQKGRRKWKGVEFSKVFQGFCVSL